MADTFISYKSEEREWASKLSGFLGANGISVWWDRELYAGENYSIKISAELRAASAVIVVWSPRAAESEYVLAEAHYARSKQKLVCTVIEPMDLPVPFNICNYSELANLAERRHGDALLTGIRSRLPKLSSNDREHDLTKPWLLIPVGFHTTETDTQFIRALRDEIDARSIPVFVREAVPFGREGVGSNPGPEAEKLFALCRKTVPIFVYLGWPRDDDSGYVWDIVLENLREVVPVVNPVQLFVGDTFAPRLSYKFGQAGEYFELGGTSRRSTLRCDVIPTTPNDLRDFVNRIVNELAAIV
jgi:hypothetical protein